MGKVFGIIVLVGGVAWADPPADVERLFAPHFDRVTPGCAVSVRHGGRVVFEGAYGSARLLSPGEPESRRRLNTPDTRFRIVSITKPVLATGVLLLRDQLLPADGDLLEKGIGEIFPELSRRSVFAGIRVRHLLEHTAGFVREPNMFWFPLGGTDDRVPAHIGFLGSWALLEGRAPGTRYEYSNLGYMLLAAVVSRKAGMSWERYLRERVFLPLGMRDAHVADPVPEQAAGRLAEGYSDNGNGAWRTERFDARGRRLRGSGGVLASVRDMARFAAAVEEGRLLSPESWRLAFTASAPSKSGVVGYGLGWSVQPPEPGPVPPGTWRHQWHNGAGYGFSTYLEVARRDEPRCRLSFVFLCNFTGGDVAGFDHGAVANGVRRAYCPDGASF